MGGLVILLMLLGFSAYQWEGSPASSVQPAAEFSDYSTGDLVFQRSSAGQGKAIQLATGSDFSHVGMILIIDGEVQVFEAVQPVRLTPIEAFVARTPDRDLVVARLKKAESVITPEVQAQMIKSVKQYIGKDYDPFFNWSDDQLYCSELVFKVYRDCANINIGTLHPLKDYHLDHPEVKRIMERRYGNNIPWDEPMIAPGAILESGLFQVLYDTRC